MTFKLNVVSSNHEHFISLWASNKASIYNRGNNGAIFKITPSFFILYNILDETTSILKLNSCYWFCHNILTLMRVNWANHILFINLFQIVCMGWPLLVNWIQFQIAAKTLLDCIWQKNRWLNVPCTNIFNFCTVSNQAKVKLYPFFEVPQ